MDTIIGQSFDGYIIQEKIGEGGIGAVFRAYDPQRERAAAVKLLYAGVRQQSDFVARFPGQMARIAALDLPGTVPVYSYGQQDGRYYVVMAYVEGPGLRQLIREHANGLPLLDVVRIGLQAAESLQAAHEQGILHGDLKPANIFLTDGGEGAAPYRVLLSDFALTGLVESHFVDTHSTIRAVTPAYLSPEQCTGGPQDGRSDLYALGVVLYEAATGTRPYPIRSAFEAASFHRTNRLVSLRAHLPGVPILLDALLRQMLAAGMEKRPESAAQVVTVLQRVLRQLEGTRRLDDAHVASRVAEVKAERRATRDLLPASPFDVHVAYFGHWDGKAYPVLGRPLRIGRQVSSDITLVSQERYVSKTHCELLWKDGVVCVRDLGSTNGTFLSETRLEPERLYPWPAEAVLRLGPFSLTLHKRAEETATGPEPAWPERKELSLLCQNGSPPQVPIGDAPLVLGRSIECEMVLNHPHVSKRHCRVERTDAGIQVTDLGSTNGTILGGERLLPHAPVNWAASVPLVIGPFSIALDMGAA